MVREKRAWCVAALVMALVALIAVSSPGDAAAESHEKPMMEGKANHFKCYPILDWTEWEPRMAKLRDQFGISEARVIKPQFLCNPVDKNGEGVPAPKYHLVCYVIHDDPSGKTERVKEVTVKNQFQEGPLWVGMGDLLCVPSMKSYEPHG